MSKGNFIGMFPGQGSQAVGMGKSFCDQFDLARDLFAVADRELGLPLARTCFEGPEDRLKETAITQPAILTVSTICFELLRGSQERDKVLLAAAGHSLGEYSALVAAGAISYSDAVNLVHKRGRYMQEAVPLGQGKMIAVLKKELEELEAALAKTQGTAEIANINSPGQIVVAGSVDGVDEFIERLGKATLIELPVSAPFHCSLMKPAEESLAKDLQAISFNTAAFPIYANFSAAAITRPDDIRESLTRQVCGRVRWVECMQNAIQHHSPEGAVEFGGKVLTGLLRRIDKSVKAKTLLQPSDLSETTEE